MKLTKKIIKELESELEVRIYNAGMYGKMSGGNDIVVKYEEEMSEDFIEEREFEKENLALIFEVEHIQQDEDGGTKNWWKIQVELDDKLKITDIKEY